MSSSPVPNTGDPHVDAALGRIRLKFIDLEDALLVQVLLDQLADNVDEFKKRLRDDVEELRSVVALQNKTLKSHNELLASHEDMVRAHEGMVWDHDETLRIHEDMLRTQAAANKSHEAFRVEHEEWMKHMQAKLDVLTDIMMRREGGPEAPQ
jgi:uncharacterized coiled-coil protein SlyX